jgi:hypothetical protein
MPPPEWMIWLLAVVIVGGGLTAFGGVVGILQCQLDFLTLIPAAIIRRL